ncbi:MAG: DUF3021 family protein [Mobilitalea sp.]
MDHIKSTVQTFFYILAGVTISSAIFITIFIPNITFSIDLLWQFIIMAAVCSFGNFIFLSKSELSKKQMKIRTICHYLFVNIVVLGGAFLWKWLTSGIPQIIVMFLLIAIVYASITIGTFRKEEKIAENLNRRLHKIYSSEEEK